MKLWLLTQRDNNGYDTYDSCIVAAETELDAKNIGPVNYRDEPEWDEHGKATDKYSAWARSRDRVTAECIGTTEREAGLILASFNAG